MQTLCLTVNGKAQTAPAGTTVAGLLALMGIDPARVAIERNEDVVPRKTWGEAPVADGDKIEIVAFIGGGSGGVRRGGRGEATRPAMTSWCSPGAGSGRGCWWAPASTSRSRRPGRPST